MDALTGQEPAVAKVDTALADLERALKGLEWSAEFSRFSGDPAAESLTALWRVLAGMGALMQARQAERREIAAAVEAQARLVVDRASAELETRSAAVVERLAPTLVRVTERQVAARLWTVRLNTLLLSGAVALVLGLAIFAVSYGAGFVNGRSQGLAEGRVVAAAMSAGAGGASAWARLMGANDPVAALKNCKAERDGTGRRYCRLPVWLDPPGAAPSK
ncbi:MAG TPA: hypothetical protein VHM90_13055 [Phycisphaerae bacterium]|nr:hypothetical protein [Phycisphaerae bacterium]